ncbi:MAG: hypothetical protein WKG00_07925 [Polyangiaceae bacterium]
MAVAHSGRTSERRAHESLEVVGRARGNHGMDERLRLAGLEPQVLERAQRLPGDVDGVRSEPGAIGCAVDVARGEALTSPTADRADREPPGMDGAMVSVQTASPAGRGLTPLSLSADYRRIFATDTGVAGEQQVRRGAAPHLESKNAPCPRHRHQKEVEARYQEIARRRRLALFKRK